jgi:hypothetical protein
MPTLIMSVSFVLLQKLSIVQFVPNITRSGFKLQP